MPNDFKVCAGSFVNRAMEIVTSSTNRLENVVAASLSAVSDNIVMSPCIILRMHGEEGLRCSLREPCSKIYSMIVAYHCVREVAKLLSFAFLYCSDITTSSSYTGAFSRSKQWTSAVEFARGRSNTMTSVRLCKQPSVPCVRGRLRMHGEVW